MKKSLALILALLLTLSLCACGKSSSSITTEAVADVAYTTADSAADYGLAASGTGSSTTVPENDPSKIIYSANVTVDTTDFDTSLTTLTELLEQYGGYVESSSFSGADYYSISRWGNNNRYAEYMIRVPSESFETLMSSFTQLGNVPYTHTYTENVTTQYYDTQARLTAYETQESRLLEMMEQAETVSDLIAIEDKLSDVRYQIESLQSTINNWDRQISYSSIDLSIQEVEEYTPEAPTSFGQELWQALLSGLDGLGQFFKNLLVFIVTALPTIVILLVLFLLLRKPIKKKWNSRKKSKNEKQENP